MEFRHAKAGGVWAAFVVAVYCVACGGAVEPTDEGVNETSEAVSEATCPTLAPNYSFTWDIDPPGVSVSPPYGTTGCLNAYRIRWYDAVVDNFFWVQHTGNVTDCTSEYAWIVVWREDGGGNYTKVQDKIEWGDLLWTGQFWICVKPKVRSDSLNPAYDYRIMASAGYMAFPSWTIKSFNFYTSDS